MQQVLGGERSLWSIPGKFIDATGHVNDPFARFPFQIEGARGPGPRFFRAPKERFQPTRRNDEVVVEECDVGRLDESERPVPRVVGGEILAGLQECEASLERTRFESLPQGRWRIAIDINELEGNLSAFID